MAGNNSLMVGAAAGVGLVPALLLGFAVVALTVKQLNGGDIASPRSVRGTVALPSG